MSIAVGASGSEAEFPFAIYDNDNVPQTGYSFSTGDVMLRLPGGVLVNATIGNIVECGNGQYVLQLTAGETATEGAACIVFDDGVNRVYSEFEMIASTTDQVLEIPFAIYDGDMVGQAGFSFSPGDLTIRLPGQTSFSNATLANVEDLGAGQYVLVLTEPERTDPGAIMVFFSDGVNQDYYRYELNSRDQSSSTPVTPPDPIPVPNPTVTLALVAHAEAAIRRLPEYARQDVPD